MKLAEALIERADLQRIWRNCKPACCKTRNTKKAKAPPKSLPRCWKNTAAPTKPCTA